MATWRFYQGLRTEWRWYRLDDAGSVIAQSDQAFAELRACMDNAETAGFSGGAYQVHARQAGALPQGTADSHEELQDLAAGLLTADAAEGSTAP